MRIALLNRLRPPNYSKKTWLIIGGCAVLVVGGVTLALLQSSSSSPAGKPGPITHSTDTPDETPPPASYEWTGASLDPKRIIIPAIEVDGFVQQVGVDQHQQIAVPNNIHMAAWFVDTVQPGQKGLSIIDGHVDGRQQDGIFKRLGQLQKDDELSVEQGNGQILHYKVLSVTSVPTAEAANILFSQDPKTSSQLNLITCGGTFDRAARAYSERIIVAAALQK